MNELSTKNIEHKIFQITDYEKSSKQQTIKHCKKGTEVKIKQYKSIFTKEINYKILTKNNQKIGLVLDNGAMKKIYNNIEYAYICNVEDYYSSKMKKRLYRCKIDIVYNINNKN